MNKRYYKPLDQRSTVHLHAQLREVLGRNDLLAWAKIMAHDEQIMELHGITYYGTNIFQKIANTLERLGYKPGD